MLYAFAKFDYDLEGQLFIKTCRIFMGPLVLTLLAEAVSIKCKLNTILGGESTGILFVYFSVQFIFEVACKLRDEYRMFVFEQQVRWE